MQSIIQLEKKLEVEFMKEWNEGNSQKKII
jgi:hypothetical protein